MININNFKGIPAGKFIAHEINKLKMSQRKFAASVNIHSQTVNAIIKGHRNLTVEMAIKIEQKLNLPEGFLLMLQTYYEIEEYKKSHKVKLNKERPNVRDILFWDTNPNDIDWVRQKDAVIKRIRERGNKEEKMEISRFYDLPLDNIN